MNIPVAVQDLASVGAAVLHRPPSHADGPPPPR